MEVIQYEEPRSWDDFGMDWNDPDPRCAHYMMALRNAFFERMAAAASDVYMYSYNVQRLSVWKTVTTDQLRRIVSDLDTLCRSYYNLDPEAYKEDFSDFPKRMRLSDVLDEDDCDAFMNASRGAILEHGGEWMRKIKNAICKLHVVQCHQTWGTTLTRSGSEHDPPFDESIGKAFERAFGDGQPSESEFKQTVPRSIYAWSGNNHWKCPRPDFEGDPEDNKDGYCGYAYAVAYRFRRLRRWLANSEVDLVMAAILDSPTGPTGWSNELATSVFDTGESGFERGLNLVRTHVDDPTDFDFTFGNIDSIPRNEVVPTSDFDSEGVATWRRSAKRGYEGKMYAFLDYECENGFRFRAGTGADSSGG
jgi:hypothetical protein